MLQSSKKVLAIALAALFLSTPLVNTASAAEPNFTAPMNLELRSDHHNRGPAPRHDNSRRPAPPQQHVRHDKPKPPPQHVRHDRPAPPPRGGYNHSSRHHRPTPPPAPPRHHSSSNDKLVGGLVIGAILGAVIANNN